MVVNKFDAVAPFYDQLARFVFGGDILNSQVCFLDEIKPTDSVLIIGGGTGRLLKQLPSCESLTYLDKSTKMLSYAVRDFDQGHFRFIVDDFFDVNLEGVFDVIICPFFLDCFNEENLVGAINRVSSLLAVDGKLIISDFDYQRRSFLMPVMHWFFRIFSSLESRKLMDIDGFLVRNGFSIEKEKFFRQKMIFSRLYRNL